jgi:maltose alpha-D-glucosyltransferase/alpha-amylase
VARALERLVVSAMPDFLPRQRWFGGKGRRLAGASLVDAGPLGPSALDPWLTLVEVAFDEAPAEVYAVPLRLAAGRELAGNALGWVEADGMRIHAADAFDDSRFCLDLLDAVAREASVSTGAGQVRFTRSSAYPASPPRGSDGVRRVMGEQSNTSVIFGEALILKAYRRVVPGPHPDLEMIRFLTTRAGFGHVPLLAGAIEYGPASGPAAALGILQRFVPNRGDGWTWALGHVRNLLGFAAGRTATDAGDVGRLVGERARASLDGLGRLGSITGGLHAALASDSGDPAFAPEPIGPEETERWAVALVGELRQTLDRLRAAGPHLPDAVRPVAERVLAAGASAARPGSGLDLLARARCSRIRIHGDYHLGQTLRTADAFVILDFEGEPARPLAERRAKHSPLRDVAGMLRSFDYAAAAAASEGGAERAALGPWAAAWAEQAASRFLAGYRSAVAGAPSRLLPESTTAVGRALDAFLLEKALYELRYEMDNRPAWIAIPLGGLARILERAEP